MGTVVYLYPPDPHDWGFVVCDRCADAEDREDDDAHRKCQYPAVFCGCFCPWLWPDGRRPMRRSP